MTDIVFDEFDQQSRSSNQSSFDGIDEQTNHHEITSIPSVIIEPATTTTTTTTTNILTRKDSIVIPSISNGSISSVLQIENGNPNVNNSTLLPVCTSNSLGDLSSTPLLLLDNPTSNSPILRTNEPPPPPLPIDSTTTNSTDPTSTTFIQCRSFRSDSSSSSKSSTSDRSAQTPVATHELLRNENEIEEQVEIPVSRSPPPPAPVVVKKAPAPLPPAPPPPAPAPPVKDPTPPPIPPSETTPSKRTISQSTGETLYYADTDKSSEIYSTDLISSQSRRALNRQNHQRHGSADLLCRQTINHEYINRSSTSTGCSSSFYPQTESFIPNAMQFYEYDQNLDYIQQIEHELKQTKEQLNATMKSIKTFWSPELKKERTLRKEESCRYQLLINEHQKRTKQDAHIQSLEHQLRQMRDELEKTRQHQRFDFVSIPPVMPIPEVQPPSNNEILVQTQRQNQDLKEKLEQRINELHAKDNECVTLKAKVDTYESKEKDLQHYISILKESILIKDQQVNMIQSEIADLRSRLKEKDSIIEKKNSKIQSIRLDRQQREFDLQEAKQQMDIRDRKINVLNRKIENLEEQIRDKSNQIAQTRAKLSAATSTGPTTTIQQQTTLTTNTLVSNLESTINEKERLIEKLREQKHSAEIEHQEEIEQLQKTIQETRIKLEQKEKDYYEGQNQIIELREQLNNSKSIFQRRENQIQNLEQQIEQLKKNSTESNDFRLFQDRFKCVELERDELKREIEWLQNEFEQQQKSTAILTTTNETNEQEEQFELILNKKQQRVEELEHAVRESLQITTEREFAMSQQKRKIENLEKQMKNLQNEIEHLRTENNDQSQILTQLKTELIERKRQYEQRLEEQIKQLDNAFISQQEKLLGELSEKDSHIADLEMDRNSTGASTRAMTIEKLNNEKQQLYNQLKELTEIRMKIIQDHLTAKEEYEQREKSLTSPACV